MSGKQEKQAISLYFHIPFCTRKCAYCHFYVIPDNEASKQDLLEGFKQEWERWLPSLQDKVIETIYFGGGTPSLFGPERIQKVINFVRESVPFVSNDIEITLEANPENISLENMKAYAEAGINRVSIGVQTLDDNLLQLLGRLHQGQDAAKAVLTTYEAGIKNISIDLMYDLPKQTLEHWENTLRKARELPITHLSLYNLTIEPHTVFFKNRELIKKQLPDEETSLKMYEKAVQLLEETGLMQYEISAFAKNDLYSRHNVGYWTARPFLGLGPSAFSYWDGKRFQNVANLKKYCDRLKSGLSPIDFEEQLEELAKRRELFLVELRMKRGVNLKEFQEKRGFLEKETLKQIDRFEADGYLLRKENTVSLSKRGILFYDTLASEIV